MDASEVIVVGSYILVLLVGVIVGLGYAYTVDRIESYHVMKNENLDVEPTNVFSMEHLKLTNALFDYFCTMPNSYFNNYRLTINENNQIEGWIAFDEIRIELDPSLVMLNSEWALEKAIRELNERVD